MRTLVNRKSLKILRYLYFRHIPVDSARLKKVVGSRFLDDSIDELLHMKYITSKGFSSTSSDGVYEIGFPCGPYEITLDGCTVAEANVKSDRRFWIPTVISIVALIKAFLPELLSLWALITK